MTRRLRAADVMDRLRDVDVEDRAATTAGRRTLGAGAEEVRREARARFGGFVLGRVNPGSRFRNRACVALDRHVFEEASNLGLLQFALPAQIGGGGRDKFDWGVVIAELARISRDPAFPVLLDISVENTELIMSSGRPELIDRYVSDLVAGRSFAVQAAYESRDPFDYETIARFEHGEWVLNGTKRFVAGAVVADLFIVYVRDEASNDMLAFLVQRDDPGVAPVRLETMGLRSMGLGQIVLHDVRLPEWRLLWRSDALSELNTYARGRRLMTACGVLGAMEGIVEACVQSLSTRRRSGRRVLDYPNVERSVGEMRALLEVARSIIYGALDNTRAPGRDPYFDELATTAKHQVSECALRVGQLVMNLEGGESYMAAFPWEQFMRDILGLIGGQGSQELLLIQLGQRSIVGFEGRQLREAGAQHAVGTLADAWWAMSALEAEECSDVSGRPDLAYPVLGVLTSAGLDLPIDTTARGEVTALLDRAHGLLAAVDADNTPEALPPRPSGALDGRLAKLAEQAWGFVVCTAAVRTGVLPHLVVPLSGQEAAARAGLSTDLVEATLDVLVRHQVVTIQEDGRYVASPGLEPVLAGGPRTSAFSARLRRAVTGAASLRATELGVPSSVRLDLPGRGDDAPLLADVLANKLLGRMEGLDELLDELGSRIGCAAGDDGRSAAALSAHIPITSVVTLEPDRPATERVLAAQLCPGDRIEVRAGEGAAFEAGDRLSLIWLPIAGHPAATLSQTIEAAAQALVPGGWIVLPCPLPPQRALSAAAARLDLTLSGGEPPAADEIEELLRRAGMSQIRRPWEDAAFGIRLITARRPGVLQSMGTHRAG